MFLVVEDSKTYLFLITEVINTFVKNPEIVTASSVDEAIKLLTGQRGEDDISLVITDYDFPGGGFNALLPHIGNKRYVVLSSKHRDVANFIPKEKIVEELPAWLLENS